ncbi:MAG: sensor histidine kinase, partial [Deferrisomatales bacterium]
MASRDPEPRSFERGLLALEGMGPPAFGEAVCALSGAEYLALLRPDPGPAHRLVLSRGFEPAAVEALGAAALDPSREPSLFPRPGQLWLREGDLAAVPLAGGCAGARWALVGVGGAWGFTALLAGAGDPPRDLVDDPLLSAALLRRLGEQAEGGGSPVQGAAWALARLSHEFKTPLVSIKGYSELILDQTTEPVGPRVRDWVRRIASGANRLAALFRRATAEARTEAAWAYHPMSVHPAAWLRWCVGEASALASGRRLDWSVDADAGLPPVGLDPDAGRDLMLELLQNAVRATPDGGAVRVEARAEPRDGRRGVRVTVRDTGVGVPGGAAADHLFERFATLGDPLRHTSGDFEFGAGGLGLGLALVRGIARAHGGAVWAEGRGRDPEGLPGAAFHLWVPQWEEPAVEEPGAGPPPRGDRLLLVEPD